MKLILCRECHDMFGLPLARLRTCECGQSAGTYRPDGDTAIVAGPCRLFGFSNAVFLTGRGEAWAYDEGNGKITRYETVAEARKTEGDGDRKPVRA